MAKTVKIIIPEDVINITLIKKYKYVVLNAIYYTGKLKSIHAFKYDTDIKQILEIRLNSLSVDTKFVDSVDYKWIPVKNTKTSIDYINYNITCMINNISYYDDKILVECYK